MKELDLERRLLSQPVGALQYMLSRLGLRYPWLPAVSVNGRFDEATLEAVIRFQRELAPPVTGVVDRRTWEEIYEAWEGEETRLTGPRELRGFPGGGRQAAPGEWKEFLSLPQTMFTALERYFNGPVTSPVPGLHEDISQQNVRWLQGGAGLEETGIMDAPTWDILSRLYELFVISQGVTEGEELPVWG